MIELEESSKPSWITSAELDLISLGQQYQKNPSEERLIKFVNQVQRVAVYLMIVGLPIGHLLPFVKAVEARAALNQNGSPYLM